ncbi:MAG: recombinase A [Myxococcales bacterium]|nr:recombinase A [Myxococcales bacterium]
MTKDLRDLLARATARATATAASAATTASAKVLRLEDLRPAQEEETAASWSLATLRGRLVELSARGATAALTTAAELVLEAQRAEDPVAWIIPAIELRESHTTSGGASRPGGPGLAPVDPRFSDRTGTFYPPDLAETGIDLAALVVVRAPSVVACARSAERLLRSGAFGLVVLDLAAVSLDRWPDQTLGRLVSLAQAHDAAVVCITEKTPETGSLGSLVSLRAEALRARRDGGEFEVTIRALKDKRRGPGWSHRLKARGPSGL